MLSGNMVLPDGTVIDKRMTPSDVHVDRPLTAISIAYLQSQDLFVTDRIFPRVNVQKQSDKYWVYNRSYWNRSEMRPRPPSTETPGGRMAVSTDAYFAEVYGVHMDVDDRVVANADSPLAPRTEATEWVTRQGLLFREMNWVDTYFKPGVWATDVTGVAATPGASQFLQFNDAASEPVKVIKDFRTQMHLTSGGFAPNVLVLGYETYNALTEHPSIIDRIKYGQTPGAPAIVNRQSLAALFEVERIEVLAAVGNMAEEAATDPANPHQTEDNQFIGDSKSAALLYVPSRPGLRTPASGYTFTWSGYIGASNGQRISTMRLETIKSDRVEIELAFDHKMVGADLGLFMASAVA